MLKILINKKFGTVAAMSAAIMFSIFSSGAYAAGSALDFLKAGEKAVKSGQYAVAIQRLDKAVSGDSLSQEQTAKALYLRGLAYSNKGEPARSIADLTKAIFFKKISPELKTQILMARAKAYRSVGLASRAEKDLRQAGAGSTQIASMRKPAAPLTRNDTGSVRRQPAPIKMIKVKPRREAAPRRETQKAVTSGWGASVQSAPTRRTETYQQPPKRVARKTSSDQYKRMFEETPRTTGRSSTGDQGGVRPAQWDANRNVNSRRVSHTQGNSRPTYNAPRSGSGRFRLQLAAVSSENDAQQAWQRLVSQHSSLLSGQSPDFQRVNLGNDKSVIRIQIGPFADKLQTLQLCNRFKENGLDCFLVVR